MRGPKHVQAVLTEAGLETSITVLEDSTRTAALAAEALGTTLGSIVKSHRIVAQ